MGRTGEEMGGTGEGMGGTGEYFTLPHLTQTES
jgi:hypothetical protein